MHTAHELFCHILKMVYLPFFFKVTPLARGNQTLWLPQYQWSDETLKNMDK